MVLFATSGTWLSHHPALMVEDATPLEPGGLNSTGICFVTEPVHRSATIEQQPSCKLLRPACLRHLGSHIGSAF